MTLQGLRVVVEVFAGVQPGVPDDDHTRRWYIEADAWDTLTDDGRLEELALLGGHATGYAAMLMLQPNKVNWVRTEWIYL